MSTTVVAAVADVHCNSTVGVNPPEVELAEGGTWLASKGGRWKWSRWAEYWDRVESLTTEYKAKLYVVINGDALDDPYHPTTEVISSNKNTIMRLAEDTYARARDMADHFFIVRGTPAHTGLGSWMEEELAKNLDAEQDEEMGTHSWYWLPMTVEDLVFDIAHHPRSSGRLPWTEDGVAGRLSAYTIVRKVRARHTVPDIILRAHAHGELSVSTAWPRAYTMRPWQTSTQYSHRLGEGGTVVPIGGLIFVCSGDHYTCEDVKYTPDEREPWRPKK